MPLLLSSGGTRVCAPRHWSSSSRGWTHVCGASGDLVKTFTSFRLQSLRPQNGPGEPGAAGFQRLTSLASKGIYASWCCVFRWPGRGGGSASRGSRVVSVWDSRGRLVGVAWTAGVGGRRGAGGVGRAAGAGGVGRPAWDGRRGTAGVGRPAWDGAWTSGGRRVDGWCGRRVDGWCGVAWTAGVESRGRLVWSRVDDWCGRLVGVAGVDSWRGRPGRVRVDGWGGRRVDGWGGCRGCSRSQVARSGPDSLAAGERRRQPSRSAAVSMSAYRSSGRVTRRRPSPSRATSARAEAPDPRPGPAAATSRSAADRVSASWSGCRCPSWSTPIVPTSFGSARSVARRSSAATTGTRRVAREHHEEVVDFSRLGQGRRQSGDHRRGWAAARRILADVLDRVAWCEELVANRADDDQPRLGGKSDQRALEQAPSSEPRPRACPTRNVGRLHRRGRSPRRGSRWRRAHRGPPGSISLGHSLVNPGTLCGGGPPGVDLAPAPFGLCRESPRRSRSGTLWSTPASSAEGASVAETVRERTKGCVSVRNGARAYETVRERTKRCPSERNGA